MNTFDVRLRVTSTDKLQDVRSSLINAISSSSVVVDILDVNVRDVPSTTQPVGHEA